LRYALTLGMTGIGLEFATASADTALAILGPAIDAALEGRVKLQ
jgi:hypothetical protein